MCDSKFYYAKIIFPIKDRFNILVLIVMLACINNMLIAESKLYREPTSGPTATLTFQNDSLMKAKIYVFENGKQCKRKRFLKVKGAYHLHKFKIHAAKKFAFLYHLSKAGIGSCTYLISFLPEKNDDYLISARTSNNNRNCHLHIIRLHPKGIFSLVNYEIRRARFTVNNEAAHCFPVSNNEKRVFTSEQ